MRKLCEALGDYRSCKCRTEQIILIDGSHLEARDDYVIDHLVNEVCDYELRSDRVSYTIFTVEEFRRRFPDDELFLLVGSDMLMIFETWHRFEDILRECTLAVVSRCEGDIPELEKKAEELRKYGNIVICRAEAVVVSSTDIRKKIAKNQKYSCYLNKNVVQYIRMKKLYQQ